MSTHEKEAREREALEKALPVLRHYASSNPKQFYRGSWQDPNGVHAALALAEAALASPPVQAREQAKPVAWMTEDGRVCAASTKNEAMHKGTAESFNIPLYTSPAEQAKPSVGGERAEYLVDRIKTLLAWGDGSSKMHLSVSACLSELSSLATINGAPVDPNSAAYQRMNVPTPPPAERQASVPEGEFNALLDHIYEYGTTAEGVRERALAMCQAYAASPTPTGAGAQLQGADDGEERHIE